MKLQSKDRKEPKRQPRTCTECRRLKVKCDKNTPCSRCVKRGITCVPTGKCKRGRWQTERANAKKKKKVIDNSCGSNFLLQSLSTVASQCRNVRNADGSHHFGISCLVRQLFFSSVAKRSLSKMSNVLLFAQKCNFDFNSIFAGTEVDVVDKTFSGPETFFSEGKVPSMERNILSLEAVPSSFLRKVGIGADLESKRCYFIMHKGSYFFNVHTSRQWANDFVSAEEMLVHHKIDESRIIEHSVPVDQIPSLMNMFASLLAKWKTPKVEVPVLQQILQLRDKNKNIKKYEVIVALHISKMCQFTYFECKPSMPESYNFDSSVEDLYKSLSWVDNYDASVPLDDVSDSILQLLLQN